MQRRILPALLLAALILGGIDPMHFRVLFGDRTVRLANMDRQTPEYPRFLEGVAARTRPGDSIVVVVPMRYWRTGYGYAYYRASYFLAGRNVIPILDDGDRVHLERLQQTQYVALWQIPEPPGYEAVWRGHGGALLRRTR